MGLFMTNFNPINNINFIKTNLNNIQNNKNVQDFNDNFNASNNLNSYNLPLNKTFEPINPTLIYDFQLAKMDNEILIKYLQSLLSIPNSIDKFIESLNSKNEDNKILKTTTSFFTKHHYIWQNNCFSVLTKTDLL